MTAFLAYSSTTGETPVDNRPLEIKLAEATEDLPDPFCFVCSRLTDHFGEHDDLVELGLASYDAETGFVYRIGHGYGSVKAVAR